jgi:hypothetical protein
MPIRRATTIAALVVLLGVAAWYVMRPDGESGQVRRRLLAFADEVNRSTADGAGPGARAARLGSYFTDDVEVDLGRGSAPIRGRETLVGMAERLQPRTTAFSLKFEDITMAMAPGGDAADVHLTAEFITRSMTARGESLDAREFTIVMRRADGEWRIGRVTAIDTLK